MIKDNQLSFSWPTVPGQMHQVEYKDNLNDASWLSLGLPLTATGDQQSFTLDISSLAHRYFRVRVLP
jgi:hypothetical protein